MGHHGPFYFEHQKLQRAQLAKISGLLSSGLMSDVTIKLINQKEKPIYVKAHKVFLAMSSTEFREYFEKIDQKDKAEEKDVKADDSLLVIKDVQLKTLNSLLKYIYSGEFDPKQVEEACDLFELARTYRIKSLEDDCESFIWANINTSCAMNVYEFALEYWRDALATATLEYIKRNTKQVLREKSFLNSKIGTVSRIFREECLNIDSEMDLVDALIAYKKSNQESDENIFSAAKGIRLMTLTENQIAECKDLELIFLQTHLFAVLVNKVSKNSNVNLPEDLNTIAEPRKPVDGVPIKGEFNCKRESNLYFKNEDETESSVCLCASEDVTLLGIEIATQTKVSLINDDEDDSYPENINFTLIDSEGNEIATSLKNSTVNYNETTVFLFSTPVKIDKDVKYTLKGVFKATGDYSVGQKGSTLKGADVTFSIEESSDDRLLYESLVSIKCRK